MIVSFSIENWMSFRNRATLSMVASRERQHGERVTRLPKYQMRLLPAAAVYGGNASGKTNLFKALAFARTQVVRGTPPDTRIPVHPFLLERGFAKKPCRFEFELLIGEVIYAFSFAMTREVVLEERLVRISSTGERTLYDRRNGQITFDQSLEEDPQFLRFAFRGTRDNQLFLTNSVSQKLQQFRPIQDWFKNTLKMVAPDARFGGGVLFFDEDHPLTMTLNEMLGNLDTGISHLGSEQVPSENIQIPEALEGEIQEQLGEGRAVLAEDEANNQFLMTRKDGELVVKKRVTVHRMTDGTEARFEVSEESDGSQRLIDLLPAFLDLSSDDSNRVYVIDQVDRSLHTLLTRRLLEDYLGTRSSDTRTQLLLTTHDVLLMDQRWLRRDEMWATERDASGGSSLFSFSEYRDVRYDKDIRKSYLQGRLGGVPRIVSPGSRHIGTEKT